MHTQDKIWYAVTLPIANDLPALSTVTFHVFSVGSEAALDESVKFATGHFYVIDNDRVASVTAD